MLAEKLNFIKDLEYKLHQKTCECEQLRSNKNKDESQIRRKDITRDFKECIKTQDLKMSKIFDPVSFDLSEFSTKIQNLKKSQQNL